MIRSAITKLAMIYLAVIMALSLGFSTLLYTIATHELSNSLRQPDTRLNYTLPDYGLVSQRRLSEGKRNIASDLILLNICMLIASAALSVYLARRTLEPIEEAFAQQTSFTSNASHELRTPITAMKTELEVAMRAKSLSKQQMNKLLDSTLEEVIKLENLSNRLLDLSRPKHFTQLSPISISNVIGNATERIKPLLDKRRQKIIIRPTSLQAMAEPTGLTDVLVILLDNACKYSPSKSIITVSTKTAKCQAVISVSDHGSGIAATDLPHIFERFYRADTSRSKNGTYGHGLGLSIAKEIIENMNGKITVHSSHSGSSFSVHLPLATSS